MVLHSQPKNFALKHSTCEVFGLKDAKKGTQGPIVDWIQIRTANPTFM